MTCSTYFKDFNPRKILSSIVLILCMCLSVYQLLGCIDKLRNPPISTHNRFGLNETLNYPAVTVCRNPPFKKDVLKQYNLLAMDSAMDQYSQWSKFPFEKATLQYIWDRATYSQQEVLLLYGLNGFAENAAVMKSYYYLRGQCFTLLPKIGEMNPGPQSGWSIMLGHDVGGSNRNSNYTTYNGNLRSSVSSIAGFHVFVHQVREPYFENILQTQSIMEYLYVEAGEEIEIKIEAQQFNQISSKDRPCVKDINYSASQCTEWKRWTEISTDAGCTGPWMPGIYLPQCTNYEQLRYLLKKYLSSDNSFHMGCNRSCNSTSYKLFIVNRVLSGKKNLSNLFIFYSSKFVTVMEEMPGYDWNSFLSDIGGSLGFFLGISVIGAIGTMENILRCILGKIKMDKTDKKEIVEFTNEVIVKK